VNGYIHQHPSQTLGCFAHAPGLHGDPAERLRAPAIETYNGESDRERLRHHHRSLVVEAGEQQHIGILGHQPEDLLPRLLSEEPDPPAQSQSSRDLAQAPLVSAGSTDDEPPIGCSCDRADRERDPFQWQ
jgi:hypothetical protein